jgi:hypothetical protein
MSTKIFVLITSVGVVKVKKESNVVRMDVTNDKLQQYFQNLLTLVENTSKTSEDSILLAGAMMSVARVVYYDVLGPHEGQHLMDANTVDLVELIKPTIH